MANIPLVKLELLIDVGLRFITIVIRGLFVFLVAKFLSLTDFGFYVVISATIGVLQYFVAGDYSYIAHRELLSKHISIVEMINGQLLVFAITFSCAVPIISILLPENTSSTVHFLCAILLLMESATSEIQRHLVILSKYRVSNVLLFIKSAGWMILMLVLLYISPQYANIMTLLNLWLIGTLISFVVGYRVILNGLQFNLALNYSFLFRYLKLMPVVLLGTIATRMLFSYDRIIVEQHINLSFAAIYGLYAGVATAFVGLIDAGVLSREYSNLVSFSLNNSSKYVSTSKSVYSRITFFTLLTIFVYYLTIDIVLGVINKDICYEYKSLGYILIVAYAIYSLAFPANCKLYAFKHDKCIAIINILSLAPLLFLIMLSQINIYDTAWAIVISATLHFALRHFILRFGYEYKNT